MSSSSESRIPVKAVVFLDREGCSCFIAIDDNSTMFSLCPEHNEERNRLNAASPSGYHFGAGIGGGWHVRPNKGPLT